MQGLNAFYYQITVWLSLGILSSVALSCSEINSNRNTIPGTAPICSLCPELAKINDTLCFINETRNFIAKTVNVGIINNHPFVVNHTSQLDAIDVNRTIELFIQDSAVAACEFKATLYALILRNNGLEAYCYRFGFPDKELGHTIVLINYKNKLIMVDPHINYTLLNANNEPAGLIETLRAIKNNSLQVYTSNDTVVGHVLLDKHLLETNPLVDSLFYHSDCDNLVESERLIRGSIYKYSRNRCFQCEKSMCFNFISRFEKELRKRTSYTKYHEGLILKTTGIAGGEYASEIDSLINKVIENET